MSFAQVGALEYYSN